MWVKTINERYTNQFNQLIIYWMGKNIFKHIL